jgi:hypothetical protein
MSKEINDTFITFKRKLLKESGSANWDDSGELRFQPDPEIYKTRVFGNVSTSRSN